MQPCLEPRLRAAALDFVLFQGIAWEVASLFQALRNRLNRGDSMGLPPVGAKAPASAAQTAGSFPASSQAGSEPFRTPKPFVPAKAPVPPPVPVPVQPAPARVLTPPSAQTAPVASAAAGLLTLDEELRIQTISVACAWVFGYQYNELQGQDVRLILPHGLLPCRELVPGLEAGHGIWVAGRSKDGSGLNLRFVLGEKRKGCRRVLTASLREVEPVAAAPATPPAPAAPGPYSNALAPSPVPAVPSRAAPQIVTLAQQVQDLSQALEEERRRRRRLEQELEQATQRFQRLETVEKQLQEATQRFERFQTVEKQLEEGTLRSRRLQSVEEQLEEATQGFRRLEAAGQGPEEPPQRFRRLETGEVVGEPGGDGLEGQPKPPAPGRGASSPV